MPLNLREFRLKYGYKDYGMLVEDFIGGLNSNWNLEIASK